jgi:predicted metal-dependent phosphoesterase TrpH
MIYDLHSHSTASDGVLSPTELIERAAIKNVDCLALTDHDTVKGIEEAEAAAKDNNIRLLPGVEISTRWKDYEIHVVGLNVDPANSGLLKGLKKQQELRHTRFENMVQKLADEGLEGTENIVGSFANGEHVGKPIVAKFLVESGYCDFPKAYEYLNRGGKFHVPTNWEFLNYIVKWITNAGGNAVIAHPDCYGMTPPSLKGFLREFKEAGGQAIEICYGACSKAAINRFSSYAKIFDLYGSSGSDFHRPAPGIELGRLKPLPRNIKPIWELFEN